jgi:fatty-acid desaturase
MISQYIVQEQDQDEDNNITKNQESCSLNNNNNNNNKVENIQLIVQKLMWKYVLIGYLQIVLGIAINIVWIWFAFYLENNMVYNASR